MPQYDPGDGSKGYVSDNLETTSGAGQATNAALSGTLLASAPFTGLYRVSVYGVVRTAPGSGTLQLSVGWTDNQQAQSLIVAQGAASGGAFVQGTAVIEVVAGNAITYSGNVTGSPVGGTYDWYFNLEPLG